MAVQMNTTQAMQDTYSAYGTKATDKSKEKDKVSQSQSKYGKTVGEPQLSEKAQKYYESLKKKYGRYDFVLVSSDQKANAQANASKYANPYKTVVLIDDEKIERMANDENYRKKYESILSGAQSQLSQLKSSMEKSGANVKGYGMQVNDGGTASFFAVLKKSSADQKARIEKKAAEKKSEKKAAEKKAEKKKQEERISERKDAKADPSKSVEDSEETVTITADSLEELLKKIDAFNQNERMNNVQTQEEKMVGQHFDSWT